MTAPRYTRQNPERRPRTSSKVTVAAKPDALAPCIDVAGIAARRLVRVKRSVPGHIRKVTTVRGRIGSTHAVEIHVALQTAWVSAIDVVARNASFEVTPCPRGVSPPSRPHPTYNPGLGVLGQRTVPYRLETTLLPLHAMAIEAVVRFVTRLALTFLARGVQRMEKTIVRFVLSLHYLPNATP